MLHRRASVHGSFARLLAAASIAGAAFGTTTTSVTSNSCRLFGLVITAIILNAAYHSAVQLADLLHDPNATASARHPPIQQPRLTGGKHKEARSLIAQLLGRIDASLGTWRATADLTGQRVP
jgi:hypothetical protein